MEWINTLLKMIGHKSTARHEFREDFKTAIDTYRKLNEDINARFAELEKENTRLKELLRLNGSLTNGDTEHEDFLIRTIAALLEERRDQEERLIFEPHLKK